MSLKVDDIIVVKSSRIRCGYKKGDTLKVVGLAVTAENFVCENLTRPDHYGYGFAFINNCDTRYKKTYPIDNSNIYQVSIFGFPVLKIKKVKNDG